MRSAAVLHRALVAAALLLATGAALAQVPPHAGGEICFTANFWCWAQPPGAPGQPCSCFDETGAQVPGVLG